MHVSVFVEVCLRLRVLILGKSGSDGLELAWSRI